MQMMMKCVGQDKTKAAGNIFGRFFFFLPAPFLFPFFFIFFFFFFF